jgi:Fis family transcriptional regulator
MQISPLNTVKNQIPVQGYTLRDYVYIALQKYFKQVGDHVPTNLYEMVISEVEAPLLQAVLKYTEGNQSQAAALLGMNRGTLRKKMKQYQLQIEMDGAMFHGEEE